MPMMLGKPMQILKDIGAHAIRIVNHRDRRDQKTDESRNKNSWASIGHGRLRLDQVVFYSSDLTAN
jgi:hypothetical protein